MRIWHVIVLVWMAATVLAFAMEEVGRVAIVVFSTGLAEVVVGLVAIMTLFKTLGALGRAEGVLAHAEALAASALVIAVAATVMMAMLFTGMGVMNAVVH